MTIRRFLLLLALIPLGAVVAANQSNVTDEDSVAVYSMLIPAPISGKPVLVLNGTVKPTPCWLKDSDIPDEDLRAAMQDFRRGNDVLRPLTWNRGAGTPEFIDRKEFESYFRRGADKGWKRFFKAHPKASGTIAFSAVGFNPNRTAAVVYSATTSCSLCGVGRFHFLRKTPQGWVKVEPNFGTCGWIS